MVILLFLVYTIDNTVRSNNTVHTTYCIIYARTICDWNTFTAHLPLSFSDINFCNNFRVHCIHIVIPYCTNKTSITNKCRKWKLASLKKILVAEALSYKGF